MTLARWLAASAATLLLAGSISAQSPSASSQDCPNSGKCSSLPTRAEILRTLPRANPGVPGIYEVFRDDVDYSVELLNERVDPPRHYPLIGQAEMHHRHYKVTVYYTETVESAYPMPFQAKKRRVETVYLVRNQLRVLPNGDTTASAESQKSETIARLVSEANQYQRDGKYKEAQVTWSKVQTLDPENTAARYGKVIAHKAQAAQEDVIVGAWDRDQGTRYESTTPALVKPLPTSGVTSSGVHPSVCQNLAYDRVSANQQGPQATEQAELIKIAWQLLHNGNTDGAAILARQVLRTEPSHKGAQDIMTVVTGGPVVHGRPMPAVTSTITIQGSAVTPTATVASGVIRPYVGQTVTFPATCVGEQNLAKCGIFETSPVCTSAQGPPACGSSVDLYPADRSCSRPCGASAKDQAIERRLQEPISVTIKDQPLEGVIETLREITGINVIADQPSLCDAGVCPKQTVSARLENVPLKAALQVMLRPLNLTYVIKDECLQITTQPPVTPQPDPRYNQPPKYPVDHAAVPMPTFSAPVVVEFHKKVVGDPTADRYYIRTGHPASALFFIEKCAAGVDCSKGCCAEANAVASCCTKECCGTADCCCKVKTAPADCCCKAKTAAVACTKECCGTANCCCKDKVVSKTTCACQPAAVACCCKAKTAATCCEKECCGTANCCCKDKVVSKTTCACQTAAAACCSGAASKNAVEVQVMVPLKLPCGQTINVPMKLSVSLATAVVNPSQPITLPTMPTPVVQPVSPVFPIMLPMSMPTPGQPGSPFNPMFPPPAPLPPPIMPRAVYQAVPYPMHAMPHPMPTAYAPPACPPGYAPVAASSPWSRTPGPEAAPMACAPVARSETWAQQGIAETLPMPTPIKATFPSLPANVKIGVKGNQIHIVSPCIDAVCDSIQVIEGGKVRLEGKVQVHFKKAHQPATVQCESVTVGLADGDFSINPMAITTGSAIRPVSYWAPTKATEPANMLTPAGWKQPKPERRSAPSKPKPATLPAMPYEGR